MPRSLPRLAVIAILAGGFSGLFGVGGGGIMVPLLVLWLGYGTREATGTSLGAIVLIALAAMTTIVTIEINVWTIISPLTLRESTSVSVGLNAELALKATNR